MPFSEIERLLGVRYEPEQVLDVLRRLGFSPTLDDDGATLRVTTPTWRNDVSLAADIVEEVARVIGYESLPERLPTGQTSSVWRDPIYLLQRQVREILAAAGGWETVSYVAIGDDDLRNLSPDDDATPGLHPIAPSSLIRLRNPIHAERDILRPTLLPSLLLIAAENLKHERSVSLFENARVYLPSTAELPHEANTLAIVRAGKREPLSRFASADQGDLDYFDLKGMIDALLERLGVDDAHFAPATVPYLHPGRAAELSVGGKRLGLLGELRPDRAAAFGIETPRVAVAEIDLDVLLSVAKPIPENVRVPHYLPVEQDFAIVVAEEIPAADVAAALRSGAGPLATGVALFDIYRGPQIGEGNKSLAYRVTFTAPDRALTDAELGKVRERIARTLQKQVHGELRA
jgi:phenylalanyl-tRNA synthetase beta chain